ncbi:Clp protease N-terminal domain-containing protein [Spirillospora albida]|uniref:Clp protease N-terminal domain-containing protein n=1 Tax=Spirillospora albida TaxID=58123 RepID=UPI0004C0608B|nr:Clp protease N-terminal domain-containing protein [Spirillospora albida]
MFERFTQDARNAVTGAQAAARGLGDRHIGTEHVLLALAGGGGPVPEALRERGLTPDALRDRIARRNAGGEGALDADALRAIGIDLDAVREATEETFGEGALDVRPGRPHRSQHGHIPFSAEAKKSLELSLRHAIRLKQKQIRAGHILLGLLHDDRSAAARIVAESDVDVAELRGAVTHLLATKAA